MAIRFSCPSCAQPIEVDDNWGGQSVGCPYCRRVVTAPPQSNWPPAEVPLASPARPLPPQSAASAQPGFAPPPPPPGYTGPFVQAVPGVPRSAPPTMSRSAGWALVLAVASVVLCG